MALGVVALALAVMLVPVPVRVTALVRTSAAALVSRVGWATGLLRRAEVARPSEPQPARPIIVPLPSEEEFLPRKKTAPARAQAGIGKSILGLGREVLDREDLWGRRH